MSTLVVHAHPLEDSYSAALRDAVVEAFVAADVDHHLVRLFTGAEPDLRGVDHLVAVYPTWNGGCPGVMLDWLQRVLSPFTDGTSAESPSPFLGLHHITVVTSHGSTRFRNRLQGQPGRQTWTRVVLTMCAPGASLDWLALYKIDRVAEAEREEFLDSVRSHFSRPAPFTSD